MFSQDGERTDFYESPRASPFNKELSNETTFSQIHLTGQYLQQAVLWLKMPLKKTPSLWKTKWAFLLNARSAEFIHSYRHIIVHEKHDFI